MVPFLFLGWILSGNAQQSQIFSHPDKQFQDALVLYNNQQYQAAQALFERVKDATEDEETEANSVY